MTDPSRWRDRPRTEGPVGVISGVHETGHAKMASQIWLTHHWFRTYAPERLVTNLRSGLACWAAWGAIYHGVPITAVVVPAQIERAKPDMVELMTDLWMRAEHRIQKPTVQERDDEVVSLSHRLLTMADMYDMEYERAKMEQQQPRGANRYMLERDQEMRYHAR